MKIDWWRACWRSKSGPEKGNKISQRQASSKSNYIKAGRRVTAWRGKQDRVSRARHSYCAAHGALRSFSPSRAGEREKKAKIARLEALSLASSLENDLMLLTEKMFAAFY